ncbi:MAG TPA: hypothetical protein DEQ32_13520 [Gammaproteobacteria bacterium]|nr:hypothetical protein [Gammaproteobacteria bacterium]
MLFQLMDTKLDCKGYYAEGELTYDDELPPSLSCTWKYSSGLEDYKRIEYANLYCGGQSIDEVCPAHLKDRLAVHTAKLKAFLRSFMEAKINAEEVCLYDMIPDRFLADYYDVKNRITEYVFDNYDRPPNYLFLRNLSVIVDKISNQSLNIDLSEMREHAHTVQGKNFIKKINTCKPVCDYNMFASKTGRLTTKKNSFPILTMDKKYRSVLKPQNDWFLELDFNAAELRTILALGDEEQPAGDLHEWNVNHIWAGTKTREEAKKSIFAWLYNPSHQDEALSKYYNRTLLMEKYYDGKEVITPFGREIPADDHHAFNYLVQSTTADLTLKQLIRVSKLLVDCKSFISFTMHDSIVIDLDHEERSLIPILVYTFMATDLGNYMVNASAGRDYGNMRGLEQ